MSVCWKKGGIFALLKQQYDKISSKLVVMKVFEMPHASFNTYLLHL